MSEPVPAAQLSAPRTARHPKSGTAAQSGATKRAVLDAASRLFCSQGYEATTIDDIVRVSGISVGSIYHHFGGKTEVFMALFRQEFETHAAASVEAAREARADGETRPAELYIAGAKAFLLSTWENREVSRLMLGDDTPPGFTVQRRESDTAFVRGARDLGLGSPPLPTSGAFAVIGLLHAAAMQIIEIEDRDKAVKIIDYFTDLIRRLAEDPAQL